MLSSREQSLPRNLTASLLPVQSPNDLDCFFQLHVSAISQFFSGELSWSRRINAVVLQHPPLPRKISGNRQSQNVTVPDFEIAAAEQPTRCFGAHDGCQFVFLCKCRYHLACTRRVLIHHENDASVKAARTKSFGNN